MMIKSLVITLVVFGIGCGSSPFKMDREAYPTQKELGQKTAVASPKLDELDDDTKYVATWQLRGPFPGKVGRVDVAPANPLDVALLANVPKTMPLTESGRCVARETAVFLLENDKLPHASLESYIRSTCGSTASFHAISYMEFNPEQKTIEQTLKSRSEKVAESFKDLPASDGELGTWAGTNADGTKGMLVLAIGVHLVDIRPFNIVPDGNGYFTLEGKVFRDVTNVYGAVTIGEYDHEDCATLPGYEPPRFKIRCKINNSDPISHFEIAGGVTGSDIQSTILLTSSVFPNKPDRKPYVAPATFIGASQIESISNAEELRQELGRMANEIRAKAQRKKLSIEVKQSAAADETYPHYLAAKREKRVKDSDFFVRGLSAGWEVKGDIVDSTFRGDCDSTGSPQQAMSVLLESPSGRKTLLGKDVSTLAIGLHQEADRDGFCAIYLGYQFLPDENHEARAARFLKTLNRARVANGKSRAKIYTSLKPTAAGFARDIESGDLTPDEAIDDFRHKVGKKWRTGTMTIYGLHTNLDRINFKSDLINAAEVKGSIMVAAYKSPGYPRTVYVVAFVYKYKGK